MSYARLSDKSDLYVYLSAGGWLECCGCTLGQTLNYPDGRPEHYVTRKTAEMVAHLEAHRAAGHLVPEGLEARLLADAAENDAECAVRSAPAPERRRMEFATLDAAFDAVADGLAAAPRLARLGLVTEAAELSWQADLLEALAAARRRKLAALRGEGTRA